MSLQPLTIFHSQIFVSSLPCSFPSRLALCKTPGCFLQSLSNPGASYGRNFKQNKEDLTSKLYELYNTSVFDSKVINSSFCSMFHLNSLEMSSDSKYIHIWNHLIALVTYRMFSFLAPRQYVSDLE